MKNEQNESKAGIVLTVAALLFVAASWLTNWDSTVLMIGGILIALIAVTMPMWSSKI